ncbi:unnamed protein product [Lactuca virosa]|uniref:YqaJ viral recombinase domain-containing protein n=1 Tax=Lactuca virosa TaxID=75947 RepID=A0AAU9M1U2_9ASTR|nr:unnamed protein product [Lactuca virosa]
MSAYKRGGGEPPSLAVDLSICGWWRHMGWFRRLEKDVGVLACCGYRVGVGVGAFDMQSITKKIRVLLHIEHCKPPASKLNWTSKMTNACVTRLHILPKRMKFQSNFVRPFPTCASPPSTSLPYNPQQWVTLTCQLTPSNSPSPAQRSKEWFALRKDRLTTSTFSTALGLWKGKRRSELWHEKVFPLDTESNITLASKQAMEWGVVNESIAIEKYKTITGREVSSLGFATHSEDKFDWIGASPDGLLGCFPNAGILEVKCPFNKGKPESAIPWSSMPFYYMPQIQGQMEVMDRDWVDLYCWTINGSTIFRICRDQDYWNLIHGVLREFWWENVIPAREALVMGSEEEAKKYEPGSTHKLTGLVIHKSLKLAAESKLLCREIAGNVEFM